MAGFRDEDELRRYVGGIFETALADPELGPQLQGTGVVFRVRMTDPDGVLTVDLGEGAVHQGEVGADPDATMTMDSSTANEYWQGKVNLPMAMARKKVSVDGRMSTLLSLAPLSKRLFPTYIQRLKDDGREDLLV